MPEMNESEAPASQIQRKRNERTEAKFFEDVEKIIAEAERLGADYKPPTEIAAVPNLKAKRDTALAQRTDYHARNSAEESKRNERERLYKPLSGDVGSLVEYAKAALTPKTDIDALKTIARTIRGARAKPIEPNGNGNHISVSHLSFASRADNYSRFIEQYASLNVKTTEDMYTVAAHRAKLAAMQKATSDVITAEADANTSGELLDRVAYLDADSLLNAALSAKAYIKSKFKNSQSFKNISKTTLQAPSRLRQK